MRLIDADALQEEYVRLSGRELSLIDSAPTVDAVEVVRCKDCKHNYYNMIPSGEAEHECSKFVELPITADFYCAWGERGEEERK